ncbi:MAG: T9SS C-terminal target domain-containing protein [Calditrichaeota bacterium]|nr:MAG: T9SS C-terminal target domain-containing protein [Calditrichota bacterium]
MGANIPVSVDDQVVAVWNDSLIYSISGWSTNTNVKNVQVYNPTVDTWSQATQIVGPGLFGHSGSIAGNLIVYTGGVKIQGFSFLIDNRTWLGQINPNNPLDITWTEIPNTPKATYRAASGTFGSTILFSGGTDNPYNFDGIGYNGIPSAPDTLTFGYNLAWDYWEFFEGSPFATMDHRGFANCWSFYYTIGGMNENQEVIDEVKYFNILADLPSVRENESIPLDFKLSQNFPNPFNPSTIINYELKITNYEFGKLTIFNVLGEKVKEFELAEPRGSVVWNGTNSFGEQVSSGIYFYKLETVNFSETKKMLLLK